MSDLRTRAIVGIGLIAVAVGALFVGGMLWWLLAALLAIGMLIEWSDLVRAGTVKKAIAVAGLVAAMLLAAPFAWGPWRDAAAAVVGLALLVAVIGNDGRLGFGLAYAGLPALALMYLRTEQQGVALTFWTLAIVWATDIGAYFAGRTFGGPLLAPVLSPKKTWSGLGGGVAAAFIVGAAIAAAAGLPHACLWLGAPLAVLAQLGDIYESGLKRKAGVKDSGALLPGHGGLLDRLDGLVPVAVVVGALVANGTLAR